MSHRSAKYPLDTRRTTYRTFPPNCLSETFFVALELLCSLEKALPRKNLSPDRVVKRQSFSRVVEISSEDLGFERHGHPHLREPLNQLRHSPSHPSLRLRQCHL